MNLHFVKKAQKTERFFGAKRPFYGLSRVIRVSYNQCRRKQTWKFKKGGFLVKVRQQIHLSGVFREEFLRLAVVFQEDDIETYHSMYFRVVRIIGGCVIE